MMKEFSSHGLKLVIATNAPRALAVRALKKLGLLDYITVVWGCDSGGGDKSSHRYFKALAHYAGFKPRTALAIGDRKATDCVLAVKAGYADAIHIRGASDLQRVCRYILAHKKPRNIRGNEEGVL